MSADDWVLIKPFWIQRGPNESVDWANLDPKTGTQKFVVTPSVSVTLRALAAAVCAGGGSPILLQGPTR